MAIRAKFTGWLEEHGIDDAVLASLYTPQEVEGEGFALLIAEHFGLGLDIDITAHIDIIRSVVAAARQREALRVQALASTPVWELAARSAKRCAAAEWSAEEARYSRPRLAVARAAAPPPPPPTRVAAGTRRQRALDGDPQGRARGEAAERERWLAELVQILRRSGVTILNPEWDGVHHEGLVAMLAGGRRASTLRARARAWRSFQQYLFLTAGVYHPRTALDAVDFINARASEPCSRAVLRNLKSLYAFIDSVTGGTPELGNNRFVIASLREAMAQAPARRAGDVSPASRYPIMLLAMMEDKIMDVNEAAYVRGLFWWTVLGCWSTLRFDDHRGIVPDGFRASGDGMSFELTRSKSTGPDKGTRLRPVYVGRGAYLRHKDWFSVGLELWQRMAPGQRDYLLCVPTADLSGVIAREVHHNEFTARLRGAIAGLRCGEVELGTAVAGCFTPHSSRNFLPSAAVALGASAADVDRLGAWATRGGAAYVRTTREHTARYQEVIGESVRSSCGGADSIADHEALEELERGMSARGVEKERRDHVIASLVWAPSGTAPRTDLPLGRTARSTGAELALTRAVCDVAAGSSSAPGREGSSAAAQAAAKAETAQVQGYVCSVTGRRGIRRLHFVGRCHRKPGFDYAMFQEHGDARPAVGEYDVICRQCWPDGFLESTDGDKGGSSVATSDESSSSGSE